MSRYPRPPFRIRVSPSALVIADAHAHMSTSEIIGFLAGTVDVKKKGNVSQRYVIDDIIEIFIAEAFPCDATEGDHVQVCTMRYC